MENQANTDNERELDLNNRTLMFIFFGFLAICGCFFVAGYVLGTWAAPSPVYYANTGAAGNSKVIDKQAGEENNRTNEIVGDTIAPPSAVIDPQSAQQKSSVPAAAVSETARSVPSETRPAVPEAVRSGSAETATAAAPPAISVPPAAVNKPAPPPKETAVKTAKTPAEKPAPPAKQATAAKAVYTVQVAAFRAHREVEITARELEAKGFESIIEPPPTPGDFYRIKVGRFASRAEAAKMAERLKENGFETMISEIKGN